jgi:hypothetical protein
MKSIVSFIFNSLSLFSLYLFNTYLHSLHIYMKLSISNYLIIYCVYIYIYEERDFASTRHVFVIQYNEWNQCKKILVNYLFLYFNKMLKNVIRLLFSYDIYVYIIIII